MTTALVTTTIFVPRNLEGYLDNAARHGHDDLFVVVVGDRKTPPEVGPYLARLERQSGYTVEYWDVERQQDFLADLPELAELLPWNSVQRRNLGYLRAVLAGAERLISIDDDNFVTDDDYFGEHGVVGETVRRPAVTTPDGWFNSASLLETEPPKPLFHRGFPLSCRGLDGSLQIGEEEGRVVVNAGLWLEVPDADAMSHLDCPARVTGFRPDAPQRLLVGRGVRTVFNSQNTALHRDLLPAIYLPPMGGTIGELTVGRYDDIWMSLFVERLVDHLGDYIAVGRPLARQDRNDHDLLDDLLLEIPAMRLTDTLIDSLAAVELTAADYAAAYGELIAGLRERIGIDPYSEDEVVYLGELLDGMEIWLATCRRVAGGRLAPSAPAGEGG